MGGVELAGKVAVITGGTRGIGFGIAKALVEAGASVVINGRSAEKGAGAIAELGVPARTRFVAGDVTRREDVEAAVNRAIDDFGRVDILVNNAGGSSGFAPVAEMSDEAWQEAAAWILHSAFWASRIALRDMSKRGFGRIINISSVEGKQANKANCCHYITYKHALNGFTKAVAFEYGAQGITSNAISPGAVETDLMKNAGPQAAASQGITYEQFLANYAQDASTRRLNTVEEIAALALLLCSDLGIGINGAILPVDGGTAL
ncbi:MAG: SDR family oxidoreductase [Pseudomonadales bacterium]|nr:SDR family oxidoreductase [Pseudomonadales bacterium]MCP5183811.1 SDR family oxidoreductase [Pseudomonadales bacterium]